MNVDQAALRKLVIAETERQAAVRLKGSIATTVEETVTGAI